MSAVTVVATGVANLAAVRAALSRAGAQVELTDRPERVRDAARLVLPGVGHFAAGRAALQGGLDEALRARVAADRPTLGICLGMQLFAEGSEEAPEVPGLAALGGRAGFFPVGCRRPHIGWNRVRAPGSARWLRSGAAYFAHSYRLTAAPAGWTAAWSGHGGRFVAALERGSVLLTQFHPELSGVWGAELIGRWLSLSNERPTLRTQGTRTTPTNASSGPAETAIPVGPRIIPCLDVDAGRVVKGVRFSGLRDAGDPVEQARRYAADGADELVLLDVSATAAGRAAAADTVAAVRAVLPIPLTVGGGIRCVADAAKLLEAGADKVAVNTAAFRDPGLLGRLAGRFGRQCVVLSIDAARRPEGGAGWEVVVRAGRERTGADALAWAAAGVAAGAGEILLTSWDRDGTGDGYDAALIGAVSQLVEVPVIASGGASGSRDIAAALRAGADAALAASIFHDGVTTVADLKQTLRVAEGLEMRL